MLILLTIAIYFLAVFVVARLTSGRSDNDAFYRGGRKSPWFLVAFGMVGASVSGVSFVSVPGMVLHTDMTYMQTCFGFVVGYIVVAFVLLPVYYRLNLTTIYTYLLQRFGRRSYKTGAAFFLLADLTGSAIKFYIVCLVLQRFVFDSYGLPFAVTVPLLMFLVWLYTRKGGVKSLVWTDSLQTFCMLGALVLIVFKVGSALNFSFLDAVTAIVADSRSRIFVFDDWHTTQNFWKQFVSGSFIVVVMTGLNQNMMQKNLTCKTLREAQKDMCSYGLAFVPVNLLFLVLGVLLVMLAGKNGMSLPASGDDLLPMFIAGGTLGDAALVLFVIGVVSASFSTVDSSLTALTTSFCVDIMERADDERLRHRVHVVMAAAFVVFILLLRMFNSTSVIDAVYILCSYTYGPLLGLFAYGLLTRSAVNDRMVPYLAVASPVLCLLAANLSSLYLGYTFGYEMLLLNGMIMFAGLKMSSGKDAKRLG